MILFVTVVDYKLWSSIVYFIVLSMIVEQRDIGVLRRFSTSGFQYTMWNLSMQVTDKDAAVGAAQECRPHYGARVLRDQLENVLLTQKFSGM